MKRRLVALVILFSFLYATLASAELKYFPMWERMPCTEGEFACYTFDQAKQILSVDLDMQLKIRTLASTEQKVVDLQFSIVELKKAAVLDKQIVLRLEKRSKEKTKELVTMTNKYITASKRDVFGETVLPWVAMGAILLFGSGALFAHLVDQ